MSEELKPVRCGCGGEASVDYFIGEPSEGASYEVYCRKCEIHTMTYDTMTEAITAWNKAMGATDTNVGNKIIYCKDCKYSHMTIDGLCKYCDIWFPNEEMYEDGNHFCASAEKR